jgi:hypothetical protein
MSVNRNIFGAIGARGILFIENLFEKACVGAQSHARKWGPNSTPPEHVRQPTQER